MCKRTSLIGVILVLIIVALTLPSSSLAQARTFSPPIYYLTISEPEPPPRGTSFTEYIGNPQKGSGGDFSDIDFPIFTIFYPIEYLDFEISWKGQAHDPSGILISPSGKPLTDNFEYRCEELTTIDHYCSYRLIGGYGMELGEYHFVLSDKADSSVFNEQRWRVEYPKQPFLTQYRLINGEYPEDTWRWKAVALMGFAPQQTLTFNFYCPHWEESNLYYGTFIAQRTFNTGTEGALYIEIELGLDGDIPCYSPDVVTMVAGYSPDYSYTAPWENFGGTAPTSDDYPLVPARHWIYIGAELTVKAESNNTYPVFSKPSLQSPNVNLVEQEKLTLLDGPVPADGEYWWSVITNKGINGWMREIDLFSIHNSY